MKKQTMPKSKCKWCVEGIVFDQRTGKKIGNRWCDLDEYDAEVGCNEGCHYYQRDAKKEAK